MCHQYDELSKTLSTFLFEMVFTVLLSYWEIVTVISVTFHFFEPVRCLLSFTIILASCILPFPKLLISHSLSIGNTLPFSLRTYMRRKVRIGTKSYAQILISNWTILIIFIRLNMAFLNALVVTLLFFCLQGSALRLILQQQNDETPSRFRLEQEGPDVLGTYVLEGIYYRKPAEIQRILQ